ncbi:MAG TPA: thiamine-phosphate kinase, partial [Casimicrobiaceae bacterium]|nr:thiamine-phosphate kinase [Casimicrobiaceae bacterium]
MSTPASPVRGNASLGEFALIERHFARSPRATDVRIGVGDDGAIVSPAAGLDYVMTVDMLVEGRHFAHDADPVLLGHKTLAVNLSDLAAMGAKPRFALLAAALPSSNSAWIASFMRGFDALASRYEVDLIGGDTTRGPLTLSVTAIGELPAGSAITRAGARPGDIVYVSGRLGDAALALAAVSGRIQIADSVLVELRQRLDAPEPRVALGLGLRGIASSALDVSDGLTGDLGHILD